MRWEKAINFALEAKSTTGDIGRITLLKPYAITLYGIAYTNHLALLCVMNRALYDKPSTTIAGHEQYDAT